MSGTLLDQQAIDQLVTAAQREADSSLEALRAVVFTGTPPGMASLTDDTDRRLVEQLVARRADQEERGAIPGSLNREMIQHPAMRQMVEGDIHAGS